MNPTKKLILVGHDKNPEDPNKAEDSGLRVFIPYDMGDRAKNCPHNQFQVFYGTAFMRDIALRDSELEGHLLCWENCNILNCPTYESEKKE